MNWIIFPRSEENLIFSKLTGSYSHFEAGLHDYLIANRALFLHAYILEECGLNPILSDPHERTMLDVGCGGGQSAMRLKQKYPHLQITGVDLSEDQIIRACHRAKKRGVTVLFDVADAQRLPFPDASFDVVYSFGCAKHWPDPLRGFGECWRVLKQGGELLVADATSDATIEQVENFYTIARFPGLFRKPVTRLLYQTMFRSALTIQAYRKIARQLNMPPETVRQVPEMPAFVFRIQKPRSFGEVGLPEW